MPLIAFLVSRASSVFALQILACTFIFRIVEKGIDAYSLSQLALAATLTSLIFALPLGFLVDRMKKKAAILVSHLLLLLLTLALVLADPFSFPAIVLASALLAVARNFRSISQFTVFGELLSNAQNKDRWVNLSTLSWQIAAFLSPLIAGLLGSSLRSLIVACGFVAISFICQIYIVAILPDTNTAEAEPSIIDNRYSILELIRFVKNNFKLHSSLTLDFFIVFFAGASTLLPFLHSGHNAAIDIGILRSALPAGIIFGTIIRLRKKSTNGWAEQLLLATVGYGICHIFLAESSSIYFSYTLLFGAGIFDALSLSIRECILQIETPPAFKGRIYALNNFLVNASDELSEWESGVAAHWLGVRSAIRISGLLAVAGAAVFAWKSRANLGISKVL